jgi:hypothetical protein
MAAYPPEASRLALKIQTGTSEQGKPVYRTLNFSGLDAAATADDVAAVASALGALLAYPVSVVSKIDSDLVA